MTQGMYPKRCVAKRQSKMVSRNRYQVGVVALLYIAVALALPMSPINVSASLSRHKEPQSLTLNQTASLGNNSPSPGKRRLLLRKGVELQTGHMLTKEQVIQQCTGVRFWHSMACTKGILWAWTC
jgi:hypothetical protein